MSFNHFLNLGEHALPFNFEIGLLAFYGFLQTFKHNCRLLILKQCQFLFQGVSEYNCRHTVNFELLWNFSQFISIAECEDNVTCRKIHQFNKVLDLVEVVA